MKISRTCVTKRQQKLLSDIENLFNVRFSGEYKRKDVGEFIKTHVHLLRDYNKRVGRKPKPTSKQLFLISEIEKTFGLHYTPLTFNGADIFIKKYYNDFILEQKYLLDSHPNWKELKKIREVIDEVAKSQYIRKKLAEKEKKK
jgi:hypothetical protein